MAIPIFLSSDDGRLNSKSHDFTTIFKPEIILDRSINHYIGLNKIEMSYSWNNISESYKNNTLKYSHNNGTTWTQIIIPNGNYTYSDIQNYINLITKENGHSSDNNEDVKFTLYTTILRIYITLSNNFQLDFSTGNLNELIGIEKKIITKSEVCSMVPNITNSIDSIIIHCNLISDSLIFGLHSDALEMISVSGLSLSYPFSFEPKRILYSKINSNIINGIRIYVTDTRNRPLDLNNVPISLSLLLK